MINIDQDKNIAYIKITGSPTIQEMQKVIHALLEHPEYKEGMDEIWDSRGSSIAHWTEDEMRSQMFFSKTAVPDVTGRIAFVVGDEVSYGMVRMWMTHAEMGGSKGVRNVFKDINSAVSWLTNK